MSQYCPNSCGDIAGNCSCSTSNQYNSFSMSSDHSNRSTMNSSYLPEPAEFGGAFEAPGSDMHGSFVSTIGPDPRTVNDLFLTTPAHMGQSYTPNLSPVDMARAHSGQQSMSSAVYSTSDRAPTRPLFAVQGHDNGMDNQPRNGHVISIPAGYRERPAPPGSLTGSSVSRDHSQRSHRSSVGSQGYPQTPISDYEVPFSGLSMSTSPQFSPYQQGARGYQMQAAYSPTDSNFNMSLSASQMAPPMARNHSSRSQKEKKFQCDIPNCPHGKPFGTRNDLERHQLAVHKIRPQNSTTKVYICQGASCLSQGKNKIWPRKDNFKNHCKVAHQEVDADTLINRSERLASSLTDKELDDLVAEDSHSGLQVTIPTNTATHNGISPVTPQLRVSLSPVSRRPSDAECLPCHSPGYLSPHGGASRRSSFSRQAPEMQTSAGSTSSSTTVRQSLHHRSFSNPNAPAMSRGVTHPSPGLHSSLSDSKISVSDLANLKSFLKPGAPDHIAQLLRSLTENNRGIKRQREDVNVNGDRRHKCEYANCNKTFKRACDLKKHMTRHTKPWGCTDPSCNKHLGSKNDWKRHELSRHYQRGAWICGQPPLIPNAIGRCTENFPSAKEFRDHLKEAHGLDQESKLKELVKTRHIGRNWAVAVWCGFCKEIISLTRENQDAWNERFDHIDSHLNGTFEASPKQLTNYPHLGDLKSRIFEISQWVPPNTDKSKGELGNSLWDSAGPRPGRYDQAGDDDDEEEDDDDDTVEETGEEGESVDSGALGLNTALGTSQGFDKNLDTASPTKRRKVTRYIWNCYNCGMGPLDWNFQVHCGDCGAAKTANVNKETHTEWVDDSD